MFTKKEFDLFTIIEGYLTHDALEDIIVYPDDYEIRFAFRNGATVSLTRRHHDLDGSELYRFIKKVFDGRTFKYDKYNLIENMADSGIAYIFEIIQNKSFRIDINTVCVY
jgi:hypothetical protein